METEIPALLAEVVACRQIVEDYTKRIDDACVEYYKTGRSLFPNLSRAENEETHTHCEFVLNRVAPLLPDVERRWQNIKYPIDQYDVEIEGFRDVWVRRRNLFRALESELRTRLALDGEERASADSVKNGDDGKKRVWRLSPAKITAIATLIMALTAVVILVRDWSPTDQPNPEESTLGESDSARNATTLNEAEAKREAERITGQWLGALRNGDVDVLTTVSGVPFFFDGAFFATPGELRARYREWLTQEPGDRGYPNPDRILTYTMAEYEDLGYAETDRIVGRLKLEPEDIVVGVFFEGEGVAFFFKNLGGTLELVGLWD